MFAQDKWTRDRLTLTFGGRFDYLNAGGSGETAPAGRFVPAREATADHLRAVLEGLVGSPRCGLRSLRHRQDRAQSLGRQVPRLAVAGIARKRESDSQRHRTRGPGPISIATARRSIANGAAQYNEIGVSGNTELRHCWRAPHRFDPTTPRPTNWEETVSITQEVHPRVALTGRLTISAISRTRRSPRNWRSIRSPTTRPYNDHRPEPMRGCRMAAARAFTMLQPAGCKNRPGRQRQHVLDAEDPHVQRDRGQRERQAPTRRIHLRRDHDRAHRHQRLRSGQRLTRITSVSARKLDPSARSYKASAGVTVPWDIQFSGSVQAVPGVDLRRTSPTTARTQASRSPARTAGRST